MERIPRTYHRNKVFPNASCIDILASDLQIESSDYEVVDVVSILLGRDNKGTVNCDGGNHVIV